MTPFLRSLRNALGGVAIFYTGMGLGAYVWAFLGVR